MTNAKKLCILIFIILLYGCFGDDSIKLTGIENYNHHVRLVKHSNLFMPAVESLGEFESIESIYFNRNPSFMNSKTINLMVTYSEDKYLIEKEHVLSNYTFLEEPIMEGNYYTMPAIEFQYQDFVIKVTYNENYIYPKWFGMIGYSDESNMICYMFYYDIEIDEIFNTENRMQSFVSEAFRFE